MTQSFDGLSIGNGTTIITNFPQRPPEVLNTPSSVVNSNARVSAIFIIDGPNSAAFTGTYTNLAATASADYAALKLKEGTVGTLINGTQTIANVALKSVSLSNQLGAGALRCTLNFELLTV